MATLTDPTGRGRKARTITATDPATGAQLTRRTDRVYVAVVVTGDPAQGHAWAQNWAGRPDLAAKALAKWGPDSHARLAPVTADPWATPAPAAQAEPAPAAPAPAPRVTLPGEPPADPLPPAPGGGLAAHRAAAAAGRPVSLAALSRTLGRELGLATGGRIPGPATAPTGDPLEGLPWDPGTPAARARVADQGRRVAILWPVAQAITGAGHPLPPAWASDGPVMAGQVGPVTALAALPAALLESAAAALAALPPVTPAQAQALELLRDALAR